MSLLRVNNITGSSTTITFKDDVTFEGDVNISSGNITASFAIANASIEKEKLTNDARDFVNILNKPAGLISSSGQFVSAISGSSLSLGGIIATGSIRTTDVFSGSGAQLFGLPNAALNNNQITINGVAVSLGGSRTLSTTDISEGTNQYYTDARVKAKMDTETVVSSSGQINYQSVVGKPTVNTLGGDGNKSFTISTGIFVTASGGADGIIVTNDTANYTLRLRTVGGTVSSSAQVAAALPASTVSSSAQVKSLLPGGTVSASAQYPGWVTASSQIDYNSITNKLSGVVSSSTQIQPLLPAGTVSSSAQVVAGVAAQTIAPTTVNATNITASALTANQAVFTNASDGFVSNAITGTGNVVMSASPTLTGTLTAANITANGTLLLQGITSQSSQVDVRNTTGIATIATTGSNTFIGNQTISGSTTITGNLTVQGTSSVLYTTSSQLNVGTNTITLNTTSVLRYGGLSVTDSGSVTNQSGSLYWDSVNNVWLFVHAGSSNTSSIVITGPENTGALGNEAFLTTNLVPKAGTSGDHIVNSQISDNGTQVGIVGSLKVTGSITASAVSGALTGTFPYASLTGLPTLVSSSTQIDYNSITNKLSGVVSSSTQVATLLPASTISSSTQFKTLTDPFSGSFTGSFVGTFPYTGLTSIPSGIMSSSAQTAANLPAGTVSSSGQINAGATSNFATAVAAQLGTVHSGSFMSTATTNNLPEGVTNLYYTDARVKSKMNSDVVMSGSFLGTATTDNLPQGSTNKYYANSLVLSYIDSLSVLSSSQQVVNRLPAGTVSSSTQIAGVQVTSASYALTASLAIGVSGSLAVSTDGLNEGTINLYYTDARVKTKLNAENVHSASFLGTATTTNLTEGINLYFTNARAIAALPGVISSSTQLPVLLPGGVVSSSAQYPGWVTASSQIDYNSITNKLSGVYSSSTQAVAAIAGQTIAPTTVNATSILSGSVLQTGTNALIGGKLAVTGSTEFTGAVTASNLTANQAVFTNANDGLVSNAITGTGNVVMSASPTLTGTLTAANITANGTLLLQNIVSQSSSPSFTGLTSTGTVLLAGIYSSSGQTDITATTGYSTFSSSLAVVDAGQTTRIDNLASLTSSYAINSTIQSQLAGVVSSSTQVKPLLPGGTVSASGQVDITTTTNYSTFSSSLATVDAGQTTRIDNLASLTSSYAINSTIQSQLAGVVSSSVQTVASIANQTIAPTNVNATNILSGSVLQTGTNALIGGKLAVTGALEVTGTVTASNLTANQAVFTNAVDGLVSNAITGTGNVVMSASPTLTGTITAANITANGTLLLQNIVSQSSSPSFTGLTSTGTVLLAGIYSSSAQTVSALSGQRINISGSQFTGIVSGSGTEYRLVVPVGTNQYAT